MVLDVFNNKNIIRSVSIWRNYVWYLNRTRRQYSNYFNSSIKRFDYRIQEYIERETVSSSILPNESYADNVVDGKLASDYLREGGI